MTARTPAPGDPARTITPDALATAVDECMIADQHRFRRRLANLKRGSDDRATESGLQRLADAVERSRARRARRLALLPTPEFPSELPVSGAREEIAEAIRSHPVTVVCGETGSGKTTQIPKICLSLGRGVGGMIGHTQPRRIAARTVSARIADELGTRLGDAVGYQVRFDDRAGSGTYVKVMTDGILLAEMQATPFLDAYDTLIIDEAHERSLNIDFVLGYLRRLLPKRPDLKVVVTSATIDPERFSRHFDDAPVVQVSGRSFPVTVRYRPLGGEADDERDQSAQSAIADAVEELCREGPGDILVFLSGERAIRETAAALRARGLAGIEILPLYARLNTAQQARIFQPHRDRRVVLATNVAETSVTVPNVRYVIDTGYARIGRYSYRTKVQRLPVEKISRASALQRQGRCGRVAPGICVRLYSEEDFEERPEFTDPEILRTNLAAVILQMKALRLGDVDAFPFLDAPDRRYVSDAFSVLGELGAIDADRRLTRLGKRLARIPVDPRMGRMVLAAESENCLAEMLIIAAALSIADPRERPAEKRQAADEVLRVFRDGRSDFLAYLNIWRFFAEHTRTLSRSKLRALCREHFLSYVRMREWQEVQRQLLILARDAGLKPNDKPASNAQIHRALLTGLLSRIGFRADRREYSGARGSKFQISRASYVQGASAKWVVAAELVETGRLYAHTVAQVRPAWIERAAGALARRSYFDAYWDAPRAEVMAYERVTLYGLTLVPKRRLRYAPIDPVVARELFIRSALVEGSWPSSAPFVEHNRALFADIERLQQKLRRVDLLAGEDELYRFFDERVPADVCGGRSFDTWWRGVESRDPQYFYLRREHVLRGEIPAGVDVNFPDRIELGGQFLELEYRFEPGGSDDGVTATVPLAVLNQVPAHGFDWLVPGMLREKIIALLRTLPKSQRRELVPLPDVVDALLPSMKPGEGRLEIELCDALRRHRGVDLEADALETDRLPAYLQVRVCVVNDSGGVLAQGRDLAAIWASLGSSSSRVFEDRAAALFNRRGRTTWDFGDLEEIVELNADGTRLRGYPTLVDERSSVSVQLVETAPQSDALSVGGVRRLLMLRFASEVRYLSRNIPDLQKLCLLYAFVADRPFGQAPESRTSACDELRDDLVEGALDRAFALANVRVRNAETFQRIADAGHTKLVPLATELFALVADVLRAHQSIASRRREATAPADSLHDIDSQLGRLVYRRFVADTARERLPELPRYLGALQRRLEKLARKSFRDASNTQRLAPMWQSCLARLDEQQRLGVRDPALEEFRWMLEELRVSLYAQDLGTAYPVSWERVEREWRKLTG